MGCSRKTTKTVDPFKVESSTFLRETVTPKEECMAKSYKCVGGYEILLCEVLCSCLLYSHTGDVNEACIE